LHRPPRMGTDSLRLTLIFVLVLGGLILTISG
jgi:hypothetical protein